MPLLILPINYKLFSYFIAIPFFRWDFCFTQGISRCRIFCHSAISTSIIPSIGSMCGPRFLSKFSGSFRHKSLIKMIKYSLFEWIKSFFKFSTICLSDQTYLGISARWHILRFDRVTDTDRFRGRSETRLRNTKKVVPKKRWKGGNIQWNEPGWKMNC